MDVRVLPVINLLLLFLFVSLAIFTPFYAYQTMASLLVVFALWFVTALLIDQKWLDGNMSFFIILLCIVMLDFIVGISNNDSQALFSGINKMPIFCWVFFFLFYATS